MEENFSIALPESIMRIIMMQCKRVIGSGEMRHARQRVVFTVQGSSYYYGWIRMAVRVKTENGVGTAAFRVFDYAVNSVLDQPIVAGETNGAIPSSAPFDDPAVSACSTDISLTISPNPVAGNVLHLSINSAHSAVTKLIILNSSGKILYKESFALAAGTTMRSLAITSLPPGLYYLEAVINKERLQIKFTKM